LESANPNKFDIELFATTARIFANEGKAREVAILAHSEYGVTWCNTNFGVEEYHAFIRTPHYILSQVEESLEELENSFIEKFNKALCGYPDLQIKYVTIAPILQGFEDWQVKAKGWLKGEKSNNQGRVRSNNIAALKCDGLLFRSNPEINLYKAFKEHEITFAPLPVFLRGGEKIKRIEPDFIIIKDGVVMLVEVDGHTVHTETPLEAHNRITMFQEEKTRIERVSANECKSIEEARKCALLLLQKLEKYIAQR
jgi:hypothetical protein